MKRVWIAIFVIFFLLFKTSSVSAQDTGWVIDDFNSDIVLHEDTHATVTEKIIVDFGNLNKHGIFREIPVTYKTESGNNLDIRFKLLGVTDEDGREYNTSITKDSSTISIKIEDADIFVSGKNTYIISYEVNRIITTPQEYAEFYWNVTGSDWPVEIKNASASIYAPNKALDSICFTGKYGADDSLCTATSDKNGTYFSSDVLKTGEGLTIATKYDMSTFNFPTKLQETIWFLEDNWIYLIPLLVFLIMLKIYSQHGRDRQYVNEFHESKITKRVPFFKRVNALHTFHPPDDLTPGEVGVLVDEVVHSKDVTATIIDLAVRGFIKIKETKKGKIIKKSDFTLILTGKNEEELKSYELSTLDMIFGTSRASKATLSKLHKKAYTHLPKIKENLYKDLTENEYFMKNPQKVRTVYVVTGLGIVFATFFVGPALASISGTVGIMFSGIASGVIIILFSFFMPAKTAKGRKALAHVVGLREYIRVGAWRQKEYEKRNFFEEALPYTIAFGLTTKFIKAFKEADLKKPDWYTGSNTFNAHSFSQSMNTFSSSMTKGVSATAPKSASSGGSGFSGGSSGGGFGGGGGGSW